MRTRHFDHVERLIENRLYVAAAGFAADLMNDDELPMDDCHFAIWHIIVVAVRNGHIDVAQDIRDVFQMEMHPQDTWRFDAWLEDLLVVDEEETYEELLLVANL